MTSNYQTANRDTACQNTQITNSNDQVRMKENYLSWQSYDKCHFSQPERKKSKIERTVIIVKYLNQPNGKRVPVPTSESLEELLVSCNKAFGTQCCKLYDTEGNEYTDVKDIADQPYAILSQIKL